MDSSAFVLLVLLIFAWSSLSCHGFRTFGFDIHHRYSDSVKGILNVDELPKMGSLEYYAAMAHRDRIIRGRGLAGDKAQFLTFSDGNETFRINTLGFLHYANISLGTPSLWFLVALDTGSDLFWIPCDCNSCIKALSTNTGSKLDLNIYSPTKSSTSKKVPCNSSLCKHQGRCSGTPTKCPYQVIYLSNGTSSSGILVEDVLHLTTDGHDNHSAVVDAPITFGCGQDQTGSFLDGAAPNGLFGLGMDKSSVPSILSSAGLTADSFSMCFGPNGVGRISFGDKGSPDQDETPFNLNQLHPTYNISVIQLSLGTNLTDIDFSAIFDSGTSFTYLNDPAYSYLSESFNSQTKDKRHPPDTQIPFEYCYDLRSDANSTLAPNVTLIMKGGSQFPVFDPLVFISEKGLLVYCLGVVKSPDVNIIGQNFMTGKRVVFDREKSVLRWKESNCYDIEGSSTMPVQPPNTTVVPPATAVEPNYTPEAKKETGNGSRTSGAPPSSDGKSSQLKSICFTFLMFYLFILLAMV